jgi:hypothetical protein
LTSAVDDLPSQSEWISDSQLNVKHGTTWRTFSFAAKGVSNHQILSSCCSRFLFLGQRERSVREAVVLRSVTPATAGFFRCEASGEGPAFRSVSGGAALSVVILPKKKPAIFGGYVINEQDGTVELNCTTDPSRPAAQIRWLINNVPVNPELIQETSVSRTSSGLETSFSFLELQSRDHFPRSGKSSGALKGSSSSNTATVTCEAAIPYSTQKAAAAPSMSSVTYWSTLSSSSTYSNGGSNAVAESAHQFQRRIASDSHQHGERIFRSRHVASAETLQSLTLRTEILIYGKYHFKIRIYNLQFK